MRFKWFDAFQMRPGLASLIHARSSSPYTLTSKESLAYMRVLCMHKNYLIEVLERRSRRYMLHNNVRVPESAAAVNVTSSI